MNAYTIFGKIEYVSILDLINNLNLIANMYGMTVTAKDENGCEIARAIPKI